MQQQQRRTGQRRVGKDVNSEKVQQRGGKQERASSRLLSKSARAVVDEVDKLLEQVDDGEEYDPDQGVDNLLDMVRGNDPLRHLNSQLGDYALEFDEEEDEDMAAQLGINLGKEDYDKGYRDEKKIENEADETDELFSLQVYVEQVRVVGKDSLEGLGFAFRLLDFPALVISPSKSGSASDFDAGKSCLFRMPMGEAARALQKTPLYFMLVDMGADSITGEEGSNDIDANSLGGARLLGSTALDLSGIAGLNLAQVSDVALPGPESQWGWRRGRFPLMDLMGNQVAVAVVRVRLCNFGDTLIPHLNQPTEEKVLVMGGPEEQTHEDNVNYDAPSESAIGSHSMRNMKRLPVPVELLETLEKIDSKVDRLEQQLRNQGLAATLAAAAADAKGGFFSRLAQTETAEKENNSKGNRWLPESGGGQSAVQPPPMYFKNEVSAGTEPDGDSTDVSYEGELENLNPSP